MSKRKTCYVDLDDIQEEQIKRHHSQSKKLSRVLRPIPGQEQPGRYDLPETESQDELVFLKVMSDPDQGVLPIPKHFARTVSQVWRVVLLHDPTAIEIPIDASFSEDVIRCTLYVAALHHSSYKGWEVPQYEPKVIYDMLRLAWQVEMEEV